VDVLSHSHPVIAGMESSLYASSQCLSFRQGWLDMQHALCGCRGLWVGGNASHGDCDYRQALACSTAGQLKHVDVGLQVVVCCVGAQAIITANPYTCALRNA
jgi:hypothetical protein